MIEVKHLYKSFGDKDVLKDINAVFEDGKTNLIIGQSGSGKTVLMKNLVGLLTPTSGEVLYDGRNFVAMTKQEKVFMRREMGMIFQSAALFDSLNVLENVMFPLDMFSSMSSRERDRRAMECIERVNLKGAETKYPDEISGGMQKRVAIARAIVLNPKYLFCDEPNSGLDPKTSLVIDRLLSDITHDYGITTIINTHDMNSVMGTSTLRRGNPERIAPPTSLHICGELSGNFLSARFAVTLNVRAQSRSSSRYSGARRVIASMSFSQTAQREMPTMPKTF